MKKKVLIIGAGPAGLTAGYELTKQGYKVTIAEKDKIVGGISRTVKYKGFRFDIGGHRFFTKNKEVENWWGEVLKEDFLKRPRLSRWYYRKKFFDYPIKPFEMLNVFGIIGSSKIVLSYGKAKIFPITPEKSLADWCINNFGNCLAKPFFIDYNEKLWGVHPSYLSKDFASQRVKGISFISTLKESFKKIFGSKKTELKSLIEEFNYPKYGPGQMWEKVSELIKKNGGEILMESDVVKINHKNGKIKSAVIKKSGKEREIYAEYILSTMPLNELIHCLNPKPPKEVIEAANSLGYRDFITVALMLNEKNLPKDNWIYTHDEGMKPIRVQIFNNWSPYMVPNESKSCIGFEYVCNEGDNLWSMKDKELVEQAKSDLKKLGFANVENVFDAQVVRLKNVYPIYLIGYNKKVDLIKKYLISEFKGYSLQPIGRGGLHRYNNSDHSMMTSFLAVKNLLGDGDYDQWNVNSDAEYHEKKE